MSILLAFFRSAAHTRARKPLGDIAFWLLARPADVAISSQARCDHFDATLYSSVRETGSGFIMAYFREVSKENLLTFRRFSSPRF